MSEKEITVKAEYSCIQEHSEINKILATVNAKNLAKLIDVVGLTANPRKPKTNKVTKAIQETLKFSAKELRFRSKGLLISSSECIQRERGRFTLSFENESYEGVLDGGHNILATGLFILEQYFGDEKSVEKLKKVKDWETFIDVWNENRKDLLEVLEAFEFEMPVEIIYPTDEYKAKFHETVFKISNARNNNAALAAGAKAHHKGYYQILKDNIDSEIAEKVQWKDGEKGNIKRDDIVALSLVPLLALQKAKKLESAVPQINPVNLYSSKSKCIEIFSTFFEKYANDEKKIEDELILSAMKLVKDMPKLYDLIYKIFPNAYNFNSQGFGSISSVRIYDDGKKGKKYLNKRPLTKYYKKECDYSYPDGFIIPIVASLYALMEIKDNKLEWKIGDPSEFIETNIKKAVEMLVSTIKDNGWNPQSVGKNLGAYKAMTFMFNFLTK